MRTRHFRTKSMEGKRRMMNNVGARSHHASLNGRIKKRAALIMHKKTECRIVQ